MLYRQHTLVRENWLISGIWFSTTNMLSFFFVLSLFVTFRLFLLDGENSAQVFNLCFVSSKGWYFSHLWLSLQFWLHYLTWQFGTLWCAFLPSYQLVGAYSWLVILSRICLILILFYEIKISVLCNIYESKMQHAGGILGIVVDLFFWVSLCFILDCPSMQTSCA